MLFVSALWSGICLSACRSDSNTKEPPIQPTKKLPDGVAPAVGTIPFDGFRPTSFRTGNSLEGYREAKKDGVRFAESDFRLTADGKLVSTHDDVTGGTCRRVSSKSLEQLKGCTIKGGQHLATLRSFLELPLTEWFIDLKDTMGGNLPRTMRAVSAAIEEIEATGRRDRAVIMVYSTAPEVTALIRKEHIRAGIKGYPKSYEQTMDLVRKGSAAGYEMACFNISQVTEQVLDESARLGVWHLAWDLKGPTSVWAERARFGLGGVITHLKQFETGQIKTSWRQAANRKAPHAKFD